MSVSVFLTGLGWGFTALVVSVFLLGYAWGIQLFQIQVTIPRIGTSDIGSIASFVVSVVALAITIYRYRQESLGAGQFFRLADLLNVDREKTQETVRQALEAESVDPKMGLVKLAIDLETLLRRKAVSAGLLPQQADALPLGQIRNSLVARHVIDDSLANSIQRVWSARNMIVHHGGDISMQEAREAMSLAAALLSKLSSG